MSISGTNEATQSVPFGTDVTATGNATANGTSATAARSDHVHKGVVANEVWQTWTPTLTNVTVGNGTQVARFVRTGRTVHAMYSLLFGSTTTFSGIPLIGLPAASADAAPIQSGLVGTSYALDSGTKEWAGGLRRTAADQITPIINDALVGTTAPFTWATNDQLGIYLTYEAAS